MTAPARARYAHSSGETCTLPSGAEAHRRRVNHPAARWSPGLHSAAPGCLGITVPRLGQEASLCGGSCPRISRELRGSTRLATLLKPLQRDTPGTGRMRRGRAPSNPGRRRPGRTWKLAAGACGGSGNHPIGGACLCRTSSQPLLNVPVLPRHLRPGNRPHTRLRRKRRASSVPCLDGGGDVMDGRLCGDRLSRARGGSPATGAVGEPATAGGRGHHADLGVAQTPGDLLDAVPGVAVASADGAGVPLRSGGGWAFVLARHGALSVLRQGLLTRIALASQSAPGPALRLEGEGVLWLGDRPPRGHH